MPTFVPFAFAGIILIGIAIAIFGYAAAKKRREQLAEFAARIGWHFDPTKRSADRKLTQFGQFTRGHSRRALNTLTGTVNTDHGECAAQAGDYRYRQTSGSGKNRRTTTYRFSYVLVTLPYPTTPDLMIRREGWLDKIGGALGFEDIDFESEEFSRKFFVKSRDRKFAYDLVDARMMEFLLAERPPRIDLESGHTCVTDGRTRWTPEQFGQQLDFAREFLNRWPRHLVARLESMTHG